MTVRWRTEHFRRRPPMDIAMAMSMALFSLFVGSSAYFFYKMAR